MTYGNPDLVRQLCGVADETQLATATILQAIDSGDSQVMTMTNRDSWNTGDKAYGLVRRASTAFAAAFCLRTFDGQIWQDKADSLEKQARAIIDDILNYDTNTAVESQSSYNSWPADSDNTPYRSPGWMSGSSSGSPTL